jgi:hypothetical protein
MGSLFCGVILLLAKLRPKGEVVMVNKVTPKSQRMLMLGRNHYLKDQYADATTVAV